MGRGPKPKPPGVCPQCEKFTGTWVRGRCSTCYVRQMRRGEIQKKPRPELPQNLTERQKEVLTGHLLGDGCLYRRKVTHTPYLSIDRARTDKLYSEWTACEFGNLSLPLVDRDVVDLRTGKTYRQTCYTTHRSTLFTEFYERWYPNNKKTLPKLLTMTPLVLAVWMCDDGNVRTTCAPHRFQLKLSTMGFTELEVERLAAMLRDRYHENFYPVNEGGKFYLASADAGTRAFLCEIDSVFPDPMNRKAVWRKPGARFYENVPRAFRRRNFYN